MDLSLSMLYLMLNIVFFIYLSFSTGSMGREVMGFFLNCIIVNLNETFICLDVTMSLIYLINRS